MLRCCFSSKLLPDVSSLVDSCLTNLPCGDCTAVHFPSHISLHSYLLTLSGLWSRLDPSLLFWSLSRWVRSGVPLENSPSCVTEGKEIADVAQPLRADKGELGQPLQGLQLKELREVKWHRDSSMQGLHTKSVSFKFCFFLSSALWPSTAHLTSFPLWFLTLRGSLGRLQETILISLGPWCAKWEVHII